MLMSIVHAAAKVLLMFVVYDVAGGHVDVYGLCCHPVSMLHDAAEYHIDINSLYCHWRPG